MSIADDLIRDEGKRLRIYVDTVGKVTGGVGRNLTDRGFREDEVALMLANDIAEATADLDSALPWWRTMTDNRQRALLNMRFNLGLPRLQGFKDMLKALQAGDYPEAAAQALASHWAAQVGDRSRRIAQLFRDG
jgi:lysozyme